MSLSFEQLVENKLDWIGGKLRTSEGGERGYKNMIITDMEIKDGAFYVYAGGGMVSAAMLNNEPSINERGDELRFNIPYIGSCYMTRNKSGV